MSFHGAILGDMHKDRPLVIDHLGYRAHDDYLVKIPTGSYVF